MDRTKAKSIGDDIRIALEAVAKKHGMKLDYRGGSFDATSYRPRLSFVEADGDRRQFEAYAATFGLVAEDFNKAFRFGGTDYRITGLALNSYKRPVLATRDDGKVFKFETRTVLSSLGRPLPASKLVEVPLPDKK